MLAIVITIMVLELKVPHGDSFEVLQNLFPVFLSYILSFVYIAIYWNNHHHMIHTCKSVTGGILWANLHLLFWLSLVPFSTGWMGENHFTSVPTLLYGLNLLFAALAYFVLQRTIIHSQGKNSILKKAIGSDWKGRVSPLIYNAAIAASLWTPMVALLLYALLALIWIVPDQRIEKVYRQ
ncbi:MAG TPA: hypothetical protein DCL41_08020 [Bdellovibrionales bacterium]|nr:hypothetical protein [Pseudobdellovibrionaceae bacterium]HAG91803.1 hypothetical protein [Bdellovibrionales bacterium]